MAISTLKARKKYKQRLLFGLAVKTLGPLFRDCGKYIPSDLEWKCGYCDAENHRTKLYSFLRKCRHCKRPPKAMQCPHCSQPNYLDKDRDPRHAARALSLALPPVIETDEEMR